MTNNLITELHAGDDVDLDQRLGTFTTVAGVRGVALGGSLHGGAVNSGTTTGIVAGGDVDLDDTTVGDDNLGLHGSQVGAFALSGPATNLVGGNVATGSGDLFDVDAHGDATVVHGHGNEVTGDIDVDLAHLDGPTNLAFGDGNRQYGFEDHSSTIEDSFDVDNSVEDSHNTVYEDSLNSVVDDRDVHERFVVDSFDTNWSDDDVTTWHSEQSSEDNSWTSDDDSFASEFTHLGVDTDVWGSGNDVELHV